MDVSQESTPKTSSCSTLLPLPNVDLLQEGGISTMSFRIDRDDVNSDTTAKLQSDEPISNKTLVSNNNVQEEAVSAEVVPTINQLIDIPIVDANFVTSPQKNIVEQKVNTPLILEPKGKEKSPNTTVPLAVTQPAVVTPKTTLSSSSAGSLPINLSSLSKNDVPLLALLQSNLPQLNQMRENLKTLIQSSLILQSLKSTTVTTPTQSTPQITKLSPSTMASIASAVGANSQKTTSIRSVTPMNKIMITPMGTAKTTPMGTAKITPMVTAKTTPMSTAKITPTGTAKTTPMGTAKTTPPLPLISATSLSPVVSTSRKPVLAQIIGKTPQRGSTVGVSGRQLLASMQYSTKQSLSTPNQNALTLLPPSSRLAEVCDSVSTLVKPIDQEPMDIDVGETPPSLDLPRHLEDHNYSIYNPTMSCVPKPLPEPTPTIPSERLSYAPEVPDSPRTLYKLLKVLPKKMNTPMLRMKPNTKYGSPTGRPIRLAYVTLNSLVVHSIDGAVALLL